VTVLVAFILVGGFIILKNLPTYTPNCIVIPPPTGGQGPSSAGAESCARHRSCSSPTSASSGFDAGQEAKKRRATEMPFGIIGSLVACTVIYILVSIVLTMIVNYKSLNVPDPVRGRGRCVSARNGGGSPGIIRKQARSSGLTSVILVLMYGQTRIFYTMARDGLLPKVFSRVHPKFRTPWIKHSAGRFDRRLRRRLSRHQHAWRHDLGSEPLIGRFGIVLPHGNLAAAYPPGYSARLSRAALSDCPRARDRHLLWADLLR